jgi:Polysaccharide deacetylase
LFVVGNYAASVKGELGELVDAGHEIASHGPDHGRLPEDPGRLDEWLRAGRSMVEDLLQVPVRGFRAPRFDVPASLGLVGYRDVVAGAGFEYVSDTHSLGHGSPVRELPVLSFHGFPMGGGSYQRLLPSSVVAGAVRSGTARSGEVPSGEVPSAEVPSAEVPSGGDAAVLYYHSYDFGATLPGLGSIRSLAVAKQLIGRGRVMRMFSEMLSRYGSKACADVGR